MTLPHPLRGETFFLFVGLAASAALHTPLLFSRSPFLNSRQFAVQPSDFSIEMSLVETSASQPDPTPDPILSTPTATSETAPPTITPPNPSALLHPSTLPLRPTPVPPTLSPSPASSTVLARPDSSRNAAPLYPDLARKKGWTGSLLLRAQISVQGTVESLSVLQSSGCELLDQSATKAVHQWHFHPQTIQGNPTPATVEIPIKFSLKH